VDDSEALFDSLRRAAGDAPADAVERLVREGSPLDLARINALAFAGAEDLAEDAAIAALLHGARLGLLEMSWSVLCPGCNGTIAARSSLRHLRETRYHCAFCQMTTEPVLDDAVEVSFMVSPRVRRIAAHDPAGLAFWDYHRQVFLGSGVVLPETEAFEALARAAVLEAVELGAGERLILSLQLPAVPVAVFDPVTHTAHVIAVEGEPTGERQDLALVFGAGRAATGRSVLRPGPLRLTLDNRTDGRVLPGVFVEGPEYNQLLGGRRPYLTAKRLLTNQTFRDLYRTDTLDVDQSLKLLSLTFLFTDLTGSTALYERVGDLVAYDLVRAHFRVLEGIVAAEGGAVVKTIGDAVMATFLTPDHGLAAALAMREAMHALNARQGSEELALKIGLHEGPCLAVSLNDRQDYFGQTVNIASRVQEIAPADGIFATEPIVRHAAVARMLEDAGLGARNLAASLRGIGDRVPVFALA
jgi:class 3 adenylate cyclase